MSSMFEIKLGEPRPKTSWVWPYFEVKTLQDGESVATCTLCNKTFKHGGSTSNLINHLAKTHKVFKPDNNTSNGGHNNNKRGSYSSVSGINELAASNFGDFLFGTWYGEGSGRFEGINDFIYNEEITIYPDEAGRGWLYYRQKTWNPMKNNSNFHSEMGYIRTPGSDKVELVLAQPTGIASIEEGRIDGTTIMFRSTDISRSSTTKIRIESDSDFSDSD
ncbi:2093_t:CDS:2 [Funneliformis geosporum]|uniref:2093_t:CDS:1 n=1 Tax=Funneliformis geosporum TaxID=1117311 RepID=A0A9W4SUX0_9GLOM|nr:2093_t:CDS:2 [Funneliformis geosporum]